MATLSPEGRRLIYSFEGKLKKISDGRYLAYRCPAGVWTIYAGCTTGVKEGMIVSEEEGEELFQKEINKHEATVARLVTVEINQNEADALISLSFNIGAAAFQRSTVLKRLNSGDRKGAAKAFEMWTKATVNGRKVDLPGLVSRRKREAALFLKPVEAPEVPAMPQEVAEAKEVSKPAIAVGAAAVATAAPAVIPVPAVPDAITQTVTQVEAWKTMGVAVWTLKAWAMAEPILASGLAVSMGGFYMWSKKQGAK